MTRDEISRMAIQSGLGARIATNKISINNFKELEVFATTVAAFAQSKEREACADIADRLPRTYRETKEAHERATLEPFHPSRFGFDFAEMRQADVITHAIRARGQA